MKHPTCLFITVVVGLCLACNSPAVNEPLLDTSTDIPVPTHPIAVAAMALTKQPYVIYDASYQSIPYPMGDVAPNRGVCADVVIRALRLCGHDLQQLVHEDMRQHFEQYPQKWGLHKPDRNIDHRRVPNLMRYFERLGKAIAITTNPTDYLPGDMVAWQLSSGLTHIGIVVAGKGANGWPLVVHNIGGGQVVANVLFSWKVIGHYRWEESREVRKSERPEIMNDECGMMNVFVIPTKEESRLIIH